MEKLMRVLRNKNENHILPFLWIHGESEEELRTAVGRIQDSGIGALCVEARPHKDFNGPQWFHDLGVLLDECKKRKMKMWLLDDSHFPTGFANGEVKKCHPELCKKYLSLKSMDFIGPLPDSGAILKYALRSPDDKILGIFLQRRIGFEEIDVSESFDLTNKIQFYEDYNTGRLNVDFMGNTMPGVQGPCPMVRFDLPEGAWTLNILTISFKGGEKQTEGYLNPIDPAATQVLLDTVYQPVYDRFKDEFGNTFQGFFSDEPRFGNIHGAENASIGRNPDMVLPWRDNLEIMLAAECGDAILDSPDGDGIRKYLPLLFIGSGDQANALRYAYMDLVSRLYSENFDGVLGRWCHEHGCMHIGHVIEDNNAVARLGYGAGHYFRAMAHTDMAGVDVVMHQLLPGFDRGWFKGFHSPGWDGEFFTYVLGKLGGSLANLDQQKQGRCMCELFGAYGWAEGNRLGKWLVDYMLVRGVNEFVPHAFNPALFPDGDCPPHFHAHGHNPQYPEFRQLMEYCNRLADLLSGGTPQFPAAVLFHAEAEWSGDYMLTQKPAAVLARSLIDYAIVPADSILMDARMENGELAIHNMHFKALVVPRAEALPRKLLINLVDFARKGLKVCFVDTLPIRCSEGTDAGNLLEALAGNVVPLDKLAETLTASGVPELVSGVSQPYLRCYHYSQSESELYFFVNEHPSNRIQTQITGAVSGHTYIYDAFSNTLTAAPDAFTLDLPPCGSQMVVVSKVPLQAASEKQAFVPAQRLSLTACTVSLASMETGCTEYGQPISLDTPRYISTLPGYETFSGRIRYCFSLELTTEQAASPARVVIDGVREGASVSVNGRHCGTRICPDYIYDISRTLQAGENTVEIELNTTLGRALNDFLSQYLPIEPTGLNGVTLEIGGTI